MSNMKFRAHETFFIRKGWLSKGMKSVIRNPNVFMGLNKDCDQKLNPMDELGIGANMVKALRYWLQVVGLTEERLEEGRKKQYLTELGMLIYDNDPYIEETGTLCLLQHQLTTNKKLATAWYYFFNVFSLRSFTKDDFITSLKGYITVEGEDVSVRSLEDDFNCIINTYISREKSVSTRAISPENNIDCPLGELELVESDNKIVKTYKKKNVSKTALPSMISLALITSWANGKKEVQIGSLLNSDKSIGRVFNLDTISLSSLLFELEAGGYLKVIRTAGLDVVRINCDLDYLQCVDNYYKYIS